MCAINLYCYYYYYYYYYYYHYKLLCLKLTTLFPNINFSGEKDSGKVLIIIIILFLIIKPDNIWVLACY